MAEEIGVETIFHNDLSEADRTKADKLIQQSNIGGEMASIVEEQENLNRPPYAMLVEDDFWFCGCSRSCAIEQGFEPREEASLVLIVAPENSDLAQKQMTIFSEGSKAWTIPLDELED